LIITAADAKEDNGIYICVSKNDLNTITQSVFIQVKGWCIVIYFLPFTLIFAFYN